MIYETVASSYDGLGLVFRPPDASVSEIPRSFVPNLLLVNKQIYSEHRYAVLLSGTLEIRLAGLTWHRNYKDYSRLRAHMRDAPTTRATSRDGRIRILEELRAFRKVNICLGLCNGYDDVSSLVSYTGLLTYDMRSQLNDLAQRFVIVVLAILRRQCPINFQLAFMAFGTHPAFYEKAHIGQFRLTRISNNHKLHLVFTPTDDGSDSEPRQKPSPFLELVGQILAFELADPNFEISITT